MTDAFLQLNTNETEAFISAPDGIVLKLMESLGPWSGVYRQMMLPVSPVRGPCYFTGVMLSTTVTHVMVNAGSL